MPLRSLLFALVAALPLSLPAQAPQPESPAPIESVEVVGGAVLSAEQLDELVGPIALHPDALVALILPAATVPAEVVLAARRLKTGATAANLEQEPWEESVKALARYPEMVAWMDENLEWTQALGEAFAAQPAEVMNAVQRQRARARAAGTLQDTPQQRVVVVDDQIQIVPAVTHVIYVPRYDPRVVYLERTRWVHRPFISFGIGYPVGYWLSYDCDWRRRTVCHVPRPDRARVWRERRDWPHRIYRHHPDRFDRDERWHAWRPRGPRDRDHWSEAERRRWRDDRRRDAPGVPGRPDWRRERERNPGLIVQQPDGWRRDRERVRTPGVPHPGWRRDDPRRLPWPGDRRGNVQSGPGQQTPGAGLPGGPTPRPAAPIRPVVPVGPTPDLHARPSPRPAAPGPVLSPQGRPLPQPHVRPPSSRGEMVRSPNGRMMPAPRSSPQASAPAPRPSPSASSTLSQRRERSPSSWDRSTSSGRGNSRSEGLRQEARGGGFRGERGRPQP